MFNIVQMLKYIGLQWTTLDFTGIFLTKLDNTRKNLADFKDLDKIVTLRQADTQSK